MSVLKSDSLRVTVPEAWEQILKGAGKARLEAALPDILPRQRWFGGKARSLRAAAITEAISLRIDKTQAILLFVEVTYRDGSPETYLLPVTAAFGDEAERIVRELPQAVLASVAAAGGGSRHGVLYDALWQEAFAQALLTAVGRGDRFSGEAGSLVTAATAAYPSIVPPESPLHACIMKAEQSNTSVQYGDRAMLKLYRRLQPGLNPDWELGRLLTASSFPFSPAVGGAIEYVRPGCEPMTVGLLQAFVPNEGDAWTMMLKAVESYLSRVPEHRADVDPNFGAGLGWWALTEASLPERARRLLGPALDAAARLGRRTAALHLALGQPREHPQLAPEPMTAEYRRMRYESMSRLWNDVGILLSNRQDALAISLRQAAAGLLTREPEIHALFRSLVGIEDGGCRIRCHGDYHLGQVLWTGADYVIIDFEGEPARPLSERRAKQSPLLDVAGMLRSFDYAASAVQQSRPTEAADLEVERWTGFWSRWVGADFLKAYLAETGTASFGPRSPRAADGLLRVYLLEKAVYELGYELNNRPGWVAIPLKGIADILNMDGARAAAALGR